MLVASTWYIEVMVSFCRATARDVGLFAASIAFIWFLDNEVVNYVPPPES